MSEHTSQADTGGWLIVIALSGALISGGFIMRGKGTDAQTATNPDANATSTDFIDAEILPRTRKLVIQKIGSLKAYNNTIAQNEIYYTASRQGKSGGVTDFVPSDPRLDLFALLLQLLEDVV